ncbi:MAG: hypothetical protein HZA95_00825 [Candidatus Vogelbacteria bacterium]|nr:hypothetical protein [Candidatus Vogelbacteria bacterium]
MIDRPDIYESHIDEQIEKYDLRGVVDEMVSYCLNTFAKEEEPSVSIPIEDVNPHKVSVIFAAVKQLVESRNPDLHVRASSWPKKFGKTEGSKYESVIFVTRK